MSSDKHRRRNYFVKKSFQSKFSLRFVVLILLEAVLIAGLFLYVSSGTLTTGYHGSDFRIEKTAEFFSVTFFLISLIVGIAMGLLGMALFVYLSHRIAGPLYKFEKILREVASGNLSQRFRLRKKDQLSSLAQDLNDLIGVLDYKIGRIKKDAEKASSLISSKNSVEDAAKLKETLNHLKETADSFKTSS